MHFSLRCIQVIAGVLGRAGETGQKQRLAAAAQGNITYQPAQGLIMGEGVPRERVDETTETIDTGLGNAEEMANKRDEVSNHESHRTKGGRDIKAIS
jgi:small subunit ribosomal protein S2